MDYVKYTVCCFNDRGGMQSGRKACGFIKQNRHQLPYIFRALAREVCSCLQVDDEKRRSICIRMFSGRIRYS